MSEDEIRDRIAKLEERAIGYLEVGNTKRADAIKNEIYKWEDLLSRINLNTEKTIKKLEDFIKAKDLWSSYLYWKN